MSYDKRQRPSDSNTRSTKRHYLTHTPKYDDVLRHNAMRFPNFRYAVILLCLVLLVASTDVREWRSWFRGSGRSDLRQRGEVSGQIRTAGQYASHDNNDGASTTKLTYSTQHIITTANSLVSAPARVLMYHPSNNTFIGYTVGPHNSTDPRMTKNANACLRCRNVLPILVDMLLTSRPSRFQPDQPPFQLFFSIADFTASRCMYDDYDCSSDANSFAPWLHFGSAFRDSTIVPRVQTMPLSNYLICIMEWRLNTSIPTCTKWKLANATTDWNDLRPKVIWRGTGFPFLPDVGRKVFDGENSNTTVPHIPWEPRQVATNWSETFSSNHSESWLDAKIVPWRRPEMTKDQLSEYKYQIDLAGIGGTTWTGTLDKLSMPGLLFHHETPAMDWFFEELRPWYHYVPVRTDLSDLKEKFDWAEAHQDEAQQIAERGRNFSTWFFSNQKMREEYEKTCDELGKVVDAYDSEESIEPSLDAYQKGNVFVIPFSSCTKDYCDINTTPAHAVRYDIPTR